MDQSPLRIRPATPADFDRLHAIDRAAFPPELAYSRRELAAWMGGRGCRTLVAEEEGEIVGFVVACLERRGRRLARAEPAPVGHLVTLDVAPARQRRGLGGRLLAAAEAWLWEVGAASIALETPAEEVDARGFYERHGYRVVRRLPRYYGRRLDAWLMLKP